MQLGVILCRDRTKERIIPFGAAARNALARYLEGTSHKMTHFIQVSFVRHFGVFRSAFDIM